MGLVNPKASKENLLSRRTKTILQGLVAFVAALWLAFAVVSSASLAETPNSGKTNLLPITATVQPAATPAQPVAPTSNSAFKIDQNFNHQTTRFPLEGMHVQVTCETCHKGGIFKGVPTACVSCHNDTMAKGKSLTHPATSNECATCHNNVDWSQVHVDHAKISKGCFTCHDGKTAEGKTKNHIKSTKLCEDCHLVTTWKVAHFNHETTNEPCQTCHDGMHTSGKPFTHIRSTNECVTCHRTISWKVGVFDHTGVVDGCVKCHDGISATGKSGGHLTTSDQCQSCHTTVAWSPSKFDHNDPIVAATVNAPFGCVTCHDGRRATGRIFPQHVATSSDDCVACHVVAGWKPAKWDHAFATDVNNCVTCHDGNHVTFAGNAKGQANAPSKHLDTTKYTNDCASCHDAAKQYVTWVGGKLDHALVQSACKDCHNNTVFAGGTSALRGKTPNHLTTSDSCESCHSTLKGISFATNTFIHLQQLPKAACVTCHNGSQSLTSNKPIMGKLQGPKQAHLPTSDTCDSCHTTDAFVPATFDHTMITGGSANCVSCHNGTIAKGMASGLLPHITVNGGSAPVCSDCHTNFTDWTSAKFDHAKVSNVCFTCHNGSTKINKAGAITALTTKSQTHIQTTAACELCHKDTTTWAATFDHSTRGTATCASCHNGTTAHGTSFAKVQHIPYPAAVDCAACHGTTNFTAFHPVTFGATEHGLVSGQCATCHNGTQAILTGFLVSKIKNHITTLADCSQCHTSFTTWVTTFNHANIGTATCVSCHNGVSAKGTANAIVTHIPFPASVSCSACHTNFTSFNPVVFGATEHALVSTTCLDCHNGTTAILKGALVKKPTPHITTAANCVTCHTSFTTWVTTFDHANITGSPTCVSCHNGVTAKGTAQALVTHIPFKASTDCGACHKNYIAFNPVTFGAAEHALVSTTCLDCHNGTVAILKGALVQKPTPHITTAANCAQCHTSFTTWVTIFDHKNVGTATCVSCHNGVTAKGKNNAAITHLPTSDDCATCHKTFTAFNPVTFGATEHALVSKTCLTCHNGTGAIFSGRLVFMPTPHIPTTANCAQCHTSFVTWVTIFDHANVGTATCASCHNGITAKGAGQAAVLHIPFKAATDCGACHKSFTAFNPVTFGAAEHALVSTTCLDCHNGTVAILKGALVKKPTPHISTTANCVQCHTSFTTWVTTFVHDAATIGGKTCVSCHDGVTAKGKKNAAVQPHIPSSDTCDDCHKNFTAFSPTVFGAAEHGLVSATTCVTCHSGSQAISTGLLKFKPTPHIPFTVGTSCGSCHTSFTTWVTTFSHANIGTATCVSCHDGVTAKGTTNAVLPHIAFNAGTDCSACHKNFVAFNPVVFGVAEHALVSPTCNNCHDGAHKIIASTIVGKIATHVPTSTDCAVCHTSVTDFKVWTFSHADTVVYATACVKCHDGQYVGVVARSKALTDLKAPPHSAAFNTCSNCHTTTAFIPAHFDHAPVIAAATPCATCHDTGKPNAVVRPTTHIAITGGKDPSGNDCGVCHTTATWVTSAKPDHSAFTAATNCFACHNTVVAKGKGTTHPASDNTCGACHNTNLFVPAVTFDHTHTATVTPCVTCHDGAHLTSNGGAKGKASFATHPNTTTSCEACHVGYVSWVTIKFDHSQGIGTCVSCHDGAHAPAIGKSGAHLASTTACANCHNTTNPKFVPAIAVDHTQVIGTCVSCHNGSIKTTVMTITGKDAKHLNTTSLCESCHVSAAFTGVLATDWKVTPNTKFDHSQAIGTCFSCHDATHTVSSGPVLGKDAKHLATTTSCANCHNTTNKLFVPAIAVDHTQTLGACFTCHNGTAKTSVMTITGKDAPHFNTSTLCESCHVSAVYSGSLVNDWKVTPNTKFDHSQAIGTCVTCHDGTHKVSSGNVLAKDAKHLNTTTACANCHNTTNAGFIPGIQPRQTDHSQVIGACFTCHSGTISISNGFVIGKLQDPHGTHIVSVNTCDTCHTTASFIGAVFDHTGVAAGTCFTCHNGNPYTGKPLTHMTSNNTCDACHTTAVWKPVPLAQFQHTATLGTCASCHKGAVTVTTAGVVMAESAAHIATTTACSNCHLSFTNWNVTAAQVDHTQVTGTCVSCHGGATKLSLTGTIISHKSATHLNSTAACDACHATGGVPWTPAKAFDHTQAIDTCFSCHNGTTKTTVKTITPKDVAHLNTTNTCESCHVSGVVATDWKVAPITKFDHSQAIGTCLACHNGTNKMGITGTVLDYKLPTHFITTKDCSVCHTTSLWNPMLTYAHTSAAYVLHYFGTTQTTCVTCHKQNNEKITYTSPTLFPNCAACHSNKFSPDPHTKYGNIRYTFTELKDCTGACHIYTDQTLTKIQTSRPTNNKHRPTSSSWN